MLTEYEFNMFKIPKPDCVIFLDVPIEYSTELMKNRKNKITGEEEKDIHELDIDYLTKCYNNSIDIAKKYNWSKIDCVENGKLKSINDIHKEVYNYAIRTIKNVER